MSYRSVHIVLRKKVVKRTINNMIEGFAQVKKRRKEPPSFKGIIRDDKEEVSRRRKPSTIQLIRLLALFCQK